MWMDCIVMGVNRRCGGKEHRRLPKQPFQPLACALSFSLAFPLRELAPASAPWELCSLGFCNLLREACEAIIRDVQSQPLFEEEGEAHRLVCTCAIHLV